MGKKNFIPKIVSSLFLCTLLSSCASAPRSTKALENKDNAIEENETVVKEINLSYPINGEETNILKPSVLLYMKAMYDQAKAIENDFVLHDFYITGTEGQNYGVVYDNETDKVRIADYYNASLNEEKSKKVTLIFDASGFNQSDEFTVTIGSKQDLSDGQQIVTKNSFVTVENLLSNKIYYWKVSSGNTTSKVESFHTKSGFRMISAGAVANIRDMGGRTVSGNKRIKQGLIFRGGELVNDTYEANGSTHSKTLYDYNKPILQDEIGIKYEIDLRGDEESHNLTQSELKDEQHQDVEYLRIPDFKAYDYFFTSSQTMGAHKALIKNMFLAFKNAQQKHVYFHCWGGADRTGTVGFLLGGLLGMSYTDLIIDFELTSFSCNYRPHNINDAKKVYRFPSLIYQMKNAKNTTTNQPYWAADKPISQIVEEILIDRIGLTAQDIAEIRANLLEE